MEAARYFNVALATSVRAKLARLAEGSRRSMGKVVEVLILKEDEDAPMWNVDGDAASLPAEVGSDGRTA
jgi:hypothetical protein